MDENTSWEEVHNLAKEAQDAENELEKGIRVQRGPKGGLYYESEAEIAPKKEPEEKVPKKVISEQELQELSEQEKVDLIPKVTQDILHRLMNDKSDKVRMAVAARLEHKITPKKEPKKVDWTAKIKSSNPKVRKKVVKKLNQNQLHLLINDPDLNVQVEVINYCNQKDLHEMLKNTNDHDVIAEISTRIDNSGLHKIIDRFSSPTNYVDKSGNRLIDDNILGLVIGNVDQKGLHRLLDLYQDKKNDLILGVSRLVDCIDKSGLEQIAKTHRDADYREEAATRLKAIAQISEVAENFKKTGKIEFTKNVAKTIKKIVKMDTESSDVISMTDEFYERIGFGDFHKKSRDAWESSANAPLAAVLKDSIQRRFGGNYTFV